MYHSPLNIKSSLNDYSVHWSSIEGKDYKDVFNSCRVAVVDKNVYDLYGHDHNTYGFLDHIIIQEAKEELKTPETCLSICKKLLEYGFKRGENLLAIGGGIIQDLVTFSTSVLFRGIPWMFIPTTLLAQADSCIGGKSSLNIGKWKNQIGNFYPPAKIVIVPEYLKTLTDQDIRSGLGEVLKVHLLSGPEMVNTIEEDYPGFNTNDKKLNDAVYRALEIKAKTIMEDEFDKGSRINFNYGHTFGHALEASSNFTIPHGIAVNMGVDIANYIAMKLGRISESDYKYLNTILQQNIKPTDKTNVDVKAFYDALKHDKKNLPDQYCFILPCKIGKVEKVFLPMSEEMDGYISEYLSVEF